MAPPLSHRWTTHSEYTDLLNYMFKRAENLDSPMPIHRMAREFKEKSGAPQSVDCIVQRIKRLRTNIPSYKHIDINTKVKVLFVLSASVYAYFLGELRKNALVQVDEKNRIVHYKAIDGSLELRRDHSLSAKDRAAQLESERYYRSSIIGYFKSKNDADAVPKNEKEKEIWNLIEFITEKCEHVNTPLNIKQLAEDFKKHFGVERSVDCIYHRVKAYCREIQKFEFLNTNSTVRQLFGLSATLHSKFLTELRKDAVVGVDDLNRITKYTAKNGRLTLLGDHSPSAKRKSDWIEREKKRNAAKNYCNAGADYDDESEKEDGYSEDDSDEYSSEEFGSEFHSDDDNDHLDQTEDETSDLGIEIPARNRSEMSNHNSFDLNARTKTSHRSEEIKAREFIEETTNPEITENAVIKTRSGRLSKRRHLDSNFSYDLVNSSSSGGLMSSSSSYSKPAKHFHPPTERSHVSKAIAMKEGDGRKGKGNNYTLGSSSSKRTGSFSNDSMRPNELDDYDPNYSIGDQVKLEPFRGSIQEDFKEINGDEDIQQIPKPLQAHNKHNQIEEVAIKVEPEDLKIIKNPTEDVKPEIAQAHGEHKELIEIPIKAEHEEPVDVKPETSHSSNIKFFEAMQSLIICLDTPSLSSIQSKVHQKIQEIEGSDEIILNNEVSLIIELLISRIIDHSEVNLSEDVESVNRSNFLCYFKASILNLKISGMEGLVKNISVLIDESQNERIPMEKVANALRAALNIDGS